MQLLYRSLCLVKKMIAAEITQPIEQNENVILRLIHEIRQYGLEYFYILFNAEE